MMSSSIELDMKEGQRSDTSEPYSNLTTKEGQALSPVEAEVVSKKKEAVKKTYADHWADENRFMATGRVYQTTISKATMQGMNYQIMLLAQYAVRGLRLGYRDFLLGTEVQDAEKFDDIVFFYEKEGGGRRAQFLQVKYSANSRDNRIDVGKLLLGGGKQLSLRVFFDSFRSMKRKPDLLGFEDELEGLVFCTNRTLRFCKLAKFNFQYEDVFEYAGRNELLNNSLLKLKCEFDDSDSAIRLITTTLKDNYVTIPKDFAECVLNGKNTFTIRRISNSLDRSYVEVLLQEIVDNECSAFRTGFIDGCELGVGSQHYRSALWISFASLKEGKSESDFQYFLRESSIKVIGDFLAHQVTKMTSEFNERLLAREIVHLIVKNKKAKVIRVNSNHSVIYQSIDQLLDFVFVEYKGAFHFRSQFFSGGWLPNMILTLKFCLQGWLSDYGLEFHDLRKYSFKFVNYTPPTLSERDCVDRLELDIREFLSVLSFSLELPSIMEMEVYTKEEMLKLNKTLTKTRVNDIYNSFVSGIMSWAMSTHGKYLRGEDLNNVLFSDCFTFDLQDPVPDFSGREASLVEIHRKLNNYDSGNNTNVPRALVIRGLGGMGKTELARKYSQMHYKSHYSHTIWLESQTIERLQHSFSTLAFQRLGLDGKTSEGERKDMRVIVEETYMYFGGMRSLFVFDNAESMEEIRDYFPRRGNDESIHVLVTSRSGNWNGFENLNLDNFTPDESFGFIKLSIGELSIFDEHEARELASKLSHFPLAIKQAVSFIKRKAKLSNNIGQSFRISSYLVLFETKSEEFLDKTFEKEIQNDYSLTAFKTMNIAVENVLNSDNPIIPTTILNIMSFLSPENIDTSFLHSALVVPHASEAALALECLWNYSIISIKEARAKIHPLIQLVNRMRLRKIGREKHVIEKCLRIASLMEVRHMISVWEYATRYDALVKQNLHILNIIAEKLIMENQIETCSEFAQRALRVIHRLVGAENMKELCFIKWIANFQNIIADTDLMPSFQREAMQNFADSSGEKYFEYLRTMCEYGIAVSKSGRVNEGLKILTEVVEVEKSIKQIDYSVSTPAKLWIMQNLDELGMEEESDRHFADYVSHLSSMTSHEIVHEAKEKEDTTKDEQEDTTKDEGKASNETKARDRNKRTRRRSGIDQIIESYFDLIVLIKILRLKGAEFDVRDILSARKVILRVHKQEALSCHGNGLIISIMEHLVRSRFDECLEILQKEITRLSDMFATKVS